MFPQYQQILLASSKLMPHPQRPTPPCLLPPVGISQSFFSPPHRSSCTNYSLSQIKCRITHERNRRAFHTHGYVCSGWDGFRGLARFIGSFCMETWDTMAVYGQTDISPLRNGQTDRPMSLGACVKI